MRSTSSRWVTGATVPRPHRRAGRTARLRGGCGRRPGSRTRRAGGELLLVFGDQRRHAGAARGHQIAHVGDAAADHRRDDFSPSRRRVATKIVEGRRDEPARSAGLELIEGHAVVGQHAGPAQHLANAQGGWGSSAWMASSGIFSWLSSIGVHRKLALRYPSPADRNGTRPCPGSTCRRIASRRRFGLAQIVADAEGQIQSRGN